jgi:hypothetical protein
MIATNARAITGPTVYASITALAKTPATATLVRDGGHPPKMIMAPGRLPVLRMKTSALREKQKWR